MHEITFANEIFSIIGAHLEKNAKDKVTAVNVRLSPFSHVTQEALRKTYQELSGTKGLAHVRLNIKTLEISLECRSCKKISHIVTPATMCPCCGSNAIDIQFGKEFFVESVEVENDDADA